MNSCNSTPSAPRTSDLDPRRLYRRPKSLGTAQIETTEHNHLQNRSWQGSIYRAVAVTFTCSGLLLVLVTFTPIVSWWNKVLTGNIRNGSGEELIVLGAAPPEYGILPESSYLRSAFAVKLYHQRRFREIIIVGGDHTALSMANFLESQGIPRDILRVETRSASTRENALYVRPFLDVSSGPPVVLTSDFHMFRTQRVFRRLGMKVLCYPVPDADRRASRWWSRWSAFIDVSTETGKIAYYFLRGWI